MQLAADYTDLYMRLRMRLTADREGLGACDGSWCGRHGLA